VENIMREPRPFFRKQTQSWYVKLGKEFVPLGNDETEAFEEYHAIMTKRRQEAVTADDSVANLIDLRWNWIKANRAETTADRVKPVLTSFKHFIGPKLKVRKLKPFHVTQWIAEKYSHVNDTTKNSLITNIKSAFGWAVDEGHIETNPIERMKKPTPAVRQEFVLALEWPQILAAATDEPFRHFLTVMLDSGARVQEMFKMEARHLDENRIIFPVAESKGKRRNRVIFLPEASAAIVSELAAKYPAGKLFRNSRGRAWNRNSIRLRFRRLKRILKMPKLTATTMRHSFAHNRLVSGQDSLVVSKLMGHVDGRMLATRYGHLDQNSEYMAGQANLIAFPSVPSSPTAAGG